MRAGTDEQILAVKTIQPDSNWIKLDAPQYTQTIQFASQGHDLLLTHKNITSHTDILMRWNLDTPNVPPKKIYEAHALAFPTEINPGQILLRSGRPFIGDKTRTHTQWVLLDNENNETPIQGATDAYGPPNIVGTGFFWVISKIGRNEDGHPKILSYPLPGGVAPIIPRERLDNLTTHLTCDKAGTRCLRDHVLSPKGNYVYDVDVLYETQQCKINNVIGYPDRVSISPDGLTAVTSIAPASDEPRRIVVIRFDPMKCESKLVQYFNFIKE